HRCHQTRSGPKLTDAPLADITVVSLEQAVAAPYATRHLADLAAGVIRVDGQDGPWSGRKGYDLLVQAEAGLLSVTGSQAEVARTGVSIADIAAGMFTFSGILTALYTRATTGVVRPVSVSLFDALVEWMSPPLYYGLSGGTAPPRTGARHPTIAPYGPFTPDDGGPVLLPGHNPA